MRRLLFGKYCNFYIDNEFVKGVICIVLNINIVFWRGMLFVMKEDGFFFVMDFDIFEMLGWYDFEG